MGRPDRRNGPHLAGALFDQLVRLSNERGWHLQAEPLRGLQVDREDKFRRLSANFLAWASARNRPPKIRDIAPSP